MNKYKKALETITNPDKVHCFECPLRVGTGEYDFKCKANSHYDKKKKEWLYNETD